ncbi:MAG: hypothetical protein ABIY62_09315 [Ginsengibacter sp.]
MSSLFQKILLFSLIPVFTMIAGGVIAIIKKPTGNMRSLILHFAAGVVFSVVGVEILPDLIKFHSPVHTIIGFTLGFLTMMAVRKFMEGNAEKKKNAMTGKLPFSLLVAVAVDIFVDGLLLGIGFSAGKSEGMLLAFALSAELLSLGMATASDLNEKKIGVKKSIITISILSFLFFVSAVLGGSLLKHVSHTIHDIILSFGIAALLFLVTEELLVEAHEERETIWHTSAFFGGFLLFLILGMYV